MGILDIGKAKYTTQASCDNCNKKVTITILKGHTIKEWIETGRARCEFCGCIISKDD